jgi:hypothetical protein
MWTRPPRAAGAGTGGERGVHRQAARGAGRAGARSCPRERGPAASSGSPAVSESRPSSAGRGPSTTTRYVAALISSTPPPAPTRPMLRKYGHSRIATTWCMSTSWTAPAKGTSPPSASWPPLTEARTPSPYSCAARPAWSAAFKLDSATQAWPATTSGLCPEHGTVKVVRKDAVAALWTRVDQLLGAYSSDWSADERGVTVDHVTNDIATHVPARHQLRSALDEARRNDLRGRQVSAPACPGIAQRNSAHAAE